MMSFGFDTERIRDEPAAAGGLLCRRPELELAVLEQRGRVLRLEWRVSDERIEVRGFHDLRCALERRVDVAVLADVALRRLLRQLGRLRREPGAALRAPSTPSSHVTLSFFRACWTSHQLSPTIATPGMRPIRPPCVPPSTTNACLTPGSLLISSTFALTTLPANTGHFTKLA